MQSLGVGENLVQFTRPLLLLTLTLTLTVSVETKLGWYFECKVPNPSMKRISYKFVFAFTFGYSNYELLFVLSRI